MSKSSTTTKKLPPIHPGEILLEDLRHAEISINGPALAIGGTPNRGSQIVHGNPFRLARYFGTSPQYWPNMQSHYDLRCLDQEAIELPPDSFQTKCSVGGGSG